MLKLRSANFRYFGRLCPRKSGIHASANDLSMEKKLDVQLSDKFAKFVAGPADGPQPQIILGTQSASRRTIIDVLAERYNFQYSVITADIDERAIRRDEPRDLVLAIAHAKAVAITKKLKDSGSLVLPGYLITCDQVVVYNGVVREKPLSEEEARYFVRSYADSPAMTVGACVCTDLITGLTTEEVDINTVHFNPFPEESIDTMVAEGTMLNCAGGLMVEHPLVKEHIVSLEGTIEGVMGLCPVSFMRVLLQSVESTPNNAAAA